MTDNYNWFRIRSSSIALLTMLLVLFASYALAQDNKPKEKSDKDNLVEVMVHPKKFYKRFFPNLRIRRNPPDTAFIKTYPHYLSLSSHILMPNIRIDLKPSGESKGSSRFTTNVPSIVGFNTSYRFISAGFAFLSRIHPHENYAKSQYRTATIKLNVKAFLFQYRFMRAKGLTDTNPFSSSDPNGLLKRTDIVNRDFQFDVLYNSSWRKYSYVAPFTFSQRQVKSHAGFLLQGGLYYSRLTGDSALIMPIQEPYFEKFDAVQMIRSLSIRLAPGFGGTAVFLRKLYASVVLLPAADLLFYRHLDNKDDDAKIRQTFGFALDSRVGVGYQSERFYAGVRYDYEQKRSSQSSVQILNRYSYLGIEVGYRFNTPRFIRKLYKDTMPPGS